MRAVRKRVVYLHGFNSSPRSDKAHQFMEWCSMRPELDVQIPALSWNPELAIRQLENLITQQMPVDLLVGSSLGGYYATWLVENFGRNNSMRAALINPAVSPCRYLGEKFLGRHRNPWTDEVYEITPAHASELGSIEPDGISDPSRYLLLVQTADEVLDYRQATAFYRGARQIVQEGGSHSFENFRNMIPTIVDFAETATNRSSL